MASSQAAAWQALATSNETNEVTSGDHPFFSILSSIQATLPQGRYHSHQGWPSNVHPKLCQISHWTLSSQPPIL